MSEGWSVHGGDSKFWSDGTMAGLRPYDCRIKLGALSKCCLELLLFSCRGGMAEVLAIECIQFGTFQYNIERILCGGQ